MFELCFSGGLLFLLDQWSELAAKTMDHKGAPVVTEMRGLLESNLYGSRCNNSPAVRIATSKLSSSNPGCLPMSDVEVRPKPARAIGPVNVVVKSPNGQSSQH